MDDHVLPYTWTNMAGTCLHEWSTAIAYVDKALDEIEVSGESHALHALAMARPIRTELLLLHGSMSTNTTSHNLLLPFKESYSG